MSRYLAAVGLVIGAAACGGGSGDGVATTETVPAEDVLDGSALDDPALVALTDAVAADVGVDAVFGAVALALDRGYTVDQLMGAAGTGAVSADGTVAGVAPAQQAFGLLVLEDVAVQSFRRLVDPVTNVEQLAEAIEPVDEGSSRPDCQATKCWPGVLLTLVEMGYTFDQVVEGVIFGELTVRYATEYESYSSGTELEVFRCIALVDSTGAVVVPEREVDKRETAVYRAYQCGSRARNGELLTADQAAAQLREDRGEAAPVSEPRPDEGAADPSGDIAPADDPVAAMSFPRTYRGEGTHILNDVVYDEAFSCTTKGPMELTLEANGTATFTYFNGVGVEATLSADGTPQIACKARPGNAWTGTYDPELWTFDIPPPTPEGFDTWDIGGFFDEGTAEVLGGYSLPPNPAGQQAIIEIEASLTT